MTSVTTWGGTARRRSGKHVAAAGGALFALLFGAGFVLQGVAVGASGEESRAEVVTRYADEQNELWVHLGGLLIGFAVIALLAFLGRLGAVLREVDGDRAVLATAAVVGGTVLAVLAAASSAARVAAFSSADFYDAYRVDPDVVLLVQTLSFAFLGYALVGAAVLVGSASIAALRSRLLPRWLAVCGLVIAAVCAFGEWALFVPVPLLLLLLWLLATSVVLVARGRRDGAPEADGAVWDREQPA